MWRNINFDAGVYEVTDKPEIGFRIKDKKERDILLPIRSHSGSH